MLVFGTLDGRMGPGWSLVIATHRLITNRFFISCVNILTVTIFVLYTVHHVCTVRFVSLTSVRYSRNWYLLVLSRLDDEVAFGWSLVCHSCSMVH